MEGVKKWVNEIINGGKEDKKKKKEKEKKKKEEKKMPQLDRFTFVSQVIWLIIVFIGIYFVLLKTGIPRIYKILSYRKKKLETIREEVIAIEKEIYIIDKGVRNIVIRFLGALKVIPEQINKIIDLNIEKNQNKIRQKLNMEREYMTIMKEEKQIKRDMEISEVLDKSTLIKEKNILKKRILN